MKIDGPRLGKSHRFPVIKPSPPVISTSKPPNNDLIRMLMVRRVPILEGTFSTSFRPLIEFIC